MKIVNFLAYPLRLSSIHKETLASEKRLEALIKKELTVSEFFADANHTSMTVEGGLVHLFSGIFISAFKEHNAINHLMIDLYDSESGQGYALTIKKFGMLSPLEKANKVKSDILAIIETADIDQETRDKIKECLK